ncbi:MAG TPA: bifunctional methylenetetrahydrofolate dehydrogenase/methenyltetrahydrofolate cyclohydrolase [Myxococcus sp.]|nr:bifunctional methylenetetrahydrofolate dehydrogenase/methenyltetrahydrofolate cyclohydrolase [Myxococcus sp.]
MTARIVDPTAEAAGFRAELRAEVAALPEPLVLAGILTADEGPSHTYAEYTRRGCADVGVRFELRRVQRLEAEDAVRAANEDPGIHGIFVFYPIFGTGQDRYLRDLVRPEKDVEGLNTFWIRCLHENRRFLDEARTKKAILPCTPLAILKLLDAAGALAGQPPRPLAGKRVCIFNRSEVVGRPLASMLSNDGAEVTSFDVDGPQLFLPDVAAGAHRVEEARVGRAEAIATADIVVTGVPSREFPLVSAAELKPGAVCLNFSTLKNFHEDVVEKAGVFIPRVGPMTVTMALRNTLRLYRNARR